MAEEVLTHTHEIIDADRPFSIDPFTKEIIADSANLTLAQRSENSERFTFTIPGTAIEGHDMTACNSVMIHYQNIAQSGDGISRGIYKVTDLKVENGLVTLSWLIGREATLHAGGLIFSIHFACVNEEGKVVYNFPTLTYSQITVGATVWNSETIAQEHPDIIAEFDARIAALEAGGGGGVPDSISVKIAQAEDGTVTITMPMSDGTTDTCVLTPGADGWPVSATLNGVVIPLTWEGW